MAVETGSPPGSAGSKSFGRLIGINLFLCEIVLVGMMVLITLEVIFRDFFNFSFQFTDEVSGYLLVAITFLSISVSLRDGALFRVEFLYHRLVPRSRHLAQFLFDLLSLAFGVILDYQLFRHVMSTWERNMVAPTLLATPLYIPQIVMPVGVSLMILVLLGEIGQDVKVLFAGGSRKGGRA
jgi:TRAP-type C4-dicarboxylate transport system permease small subunit